MPAKGWHGRVRRCGSPRGSLKFEGKKEDDGHEIERHVERRGRKGQKKTKKVGYCRYTSERKILAADSSRVSAARAMRASQPDPQRSVVECKEARWWYEMQQTCQRVAATDRKHESRVRNEDRDRER